MSDATRQLDPDDLFRRAAERAVDEPGWLGHALLRFAELERLGTVAAVAARLRPGGPPIAGRELSRLMLCRTPTGPAMPRQAAEVAEAFGLDRSALVAVLRRVEVADAFARDAGGSLLAARRDEDADDEDESPAAPPRDPQRDGGDAS